MSIDRKEIVRRFKANVRLMAEEQKREAAKAADHGYGLDEGPPAESCYNNISNINVVGGGNSLGDPLCNGVIKGVAAFQPVECVATNLDSRAIDTLRLKDAIMYRHLSVIRSASRLAKRAGDSRANFAATGAVPDKVAVTLVAFIARFMVTRIMLADGYFPDEPRGTSTMDPVMLRSSEYDEDLHLGDVTVAPALAPEAMGLWFSLFVEGGPSCWNWTKGALGHVPGVNHDVKRHVGSMVKFPGGYSRKLWVLTESDYDRNFPFGSASFTAAACDEVLNYLAASVPADAMNSASKEAMAICRGHAGLLEGTVDLDGNAWANSEAQTAVARYGPATIVKGVNAAGATIDLPVETDDAANWDNPGGVALPYLNVGINPGPTAGCYLEAGKRAILLGKFADDLSGLIDRESRWVNVPVTSPKVICTMDRDQAHVNVIVREWAGARAANGAQAVQMERRFKLELTDPAPFNNLIITNQLDYVEVGGALPVGHFLMNAVMARHWAHLQRCSRIRPPVAHNAIPNIPNYTWCDVDGMRVKQPQMVYLNAPSVSAWVGGAFSVVCDAENADKIVDGMAEVKSYKGEGPMYAWWCDPGTISSRCDSFAARRNVATVRALNIKGLCAASLNYGSLGDIMTTLHGSSLWTCRSEVALNSSCSLTNNFIGYHSGGCAAIIGKKSDVYVGLDVDGSYHCDDAGDVFSSSSPDSTAVLEANFRKTLSMMPLPIAAGAAPRPHMAAMATRGRGHMAIMLYKGSDNIRLPNRHLVPCTLLQRHYSIVGMCEKWESVRGTTKVATYEPIAMQALPLRGGVPLPAAYNVAASFTA